MLIRIGFVGALGSAGKTRNGAIFTISLWRVDCVISGLSILFWSLRVIADEIGRTQSCVRMIEL